MIVVAGMMADQPVRLLCGRLTALEYDYVFIDAASIPQDLDIRQSWSADGRISGVLTAGGKSVAFEDITGVYYRHSDYRKKNFLYDLALSGEEVELVKGERHAFLSSVFDFLPCVVVNRLRSMLSNDSKPVQSLVAQAFGLSVPKTLITSVPDEALAFREECGGKVIYKPVGSFRTTVQLVEQADLERIHLIRNCPVQFQERIEGHNVRVHVVGQEIFTTRIESKGVDYRYASNRYEPVELPEALADTCRRLTKYFGLHMSGIDFLERDGEYFFLECNPSPGYSFFEIHAFQPISTAISNLLRNGKQAYEDWLESEPRDRSLGRGIPRGVLPTTA